MLDKVEILAKRLGYRNLGSFIVHLIMLLIVIVAATYLFLYTIPEDKTQAICISFMLNHTDVLDRVCLIRRGLLDQNISKIFQP